MSDVHANVNLGRLFHNHWVEAVVAFNQVYNQLVNVYLNQQSHPAGLCSRKRLLAHIWLMEKQLEILLAETDHLDEANDLVVHADRLDDLTRQAKLMLNLATQPAC